MAKTGGPKPSPTHLKLLAGTRKDRINQREPQPSGGIPEPPDYLDAAAGRKWERLAPKLHALGVLTAVDGDALALLCSLHSKLLECERQLKRDGLVHCSELLGSTKVNPYWKVYMECVRQLESLYAHFGLTPSSRSRIAVKDPRPSDAFEEFLAGDRGQ